MADRRSCTSTKGRFRLAMRRVVVVDVDRVYSNSHDTMCIGVAGGVAAGPRRSTPKRGAMLTRAVAMARRQKGESRTRVCAGTVDGVGQQEGIQRGRRRQKDRGRGRHTSRLVW